MMDWGPYLVGGAAARADSMSGLNGDMNARLARMFQSAPPEIQRHLRLTSAYRSPEQQAQLWADALKKHGSEAAARKWVAPPGRSNHNHGTAVDLKYLDPSAQSWAHENAAQYGLAFPLGNEPWHIEMAEARGRAPTTMADAPSWPMGTPAPAPGIADMFGGPPAPRDSGPAAYAPPSTPAYQAQAATLVDPGAARARREAMLADVGTWFL